MNKANQRLNRREFLKQTTQAGVLALGATGPRSLSTAGEPNAAATIQIGLLLGTFGSGTLEARLDAVKACGLDGVQVSLDCTGLSDMPDEIPPEVSDRIRREAAARRITIASVPGTFNMSHPDAEQRRTGLKRLRVLAEACSQLNTSKIHLCTGTRDRGNLWRRHPDNDSPEVWRDMAACVREATEIARQTRVVLAFEPEVNNVVNSAQKARRLLDEIASPHLKVTIDPANLFHTGELPRMREILDEAFALVGKESSWRTPRTSTTMATQAISRPAKASWTTMAIFSPCCRPSGSKGRFCSMGSAQHRCPVAWRSCGRSRRASLRYLPGSDRSAAEVLVIRPISTVNGGARRGR
jgi:sugar phosphate isomerase/epimerase